MHKKTSIQINFDFPDIKEILKMKILQVSELEEKEKNYILNFLQSLPNGNNLCHFDFHPRNILKTKNDFYIIDWALAAKGDLNSDIARTIIILKYADLQINNPIVRIFTRIRRYYFLYHYLRTLVIRNQKKEIQSWFIIILAARLSERISKKERKKIIRIVKKISTVPRFINSNSPS
nr:phosphotransferase [Breznakia pachnodae]